MPYTHAHGVVFPYEDARLRLNRGLRLNPTSKEGPDSRRATSNPSKPLDSGFFFPEHDAKGLS